MRKVGINLLVIGLVAFLGVNAAYAGYLETLRNSNDSRITGIYNYDSSGTTLLTVLNPSNGNVTHYENGRREFVLDAGGVKIVDFIWDGAILLNEINSGGTVPYTWSYVNGKRTEAYTNDGTLFMKAGYFQDLVVAGWGTMTTAQKNTYLAGLLGTVTTADIDFVRPIIDDAFSGGNLRAGLSPAGQYLQIVFLRNDVGGIFANNVTFYDGNGNSSVEVTLTDSTISGQDPVVTGTINKDEFGRYYIETAEGDIYYLSKNNRGRHDNGNFETWLGSTAGVTRGLTVWKTCDANGDGVISNDRNGDGSTGDYEGAWIGIDQAMNGAYGLTFEEVFGNLDVQEFDDYMEAHLGQEVSLVGDLSNSGANIFYVQGEANASGLTNITHL